MSQHYATQEPFSLDELRTASGFSHSSFNNYRSKQFGTFLVPSSDGKVRINHAFRRFNTWQKFRDEVVSQKRRLIRDYRPVGLQRVMSFEFFMPLRNEEWLREALDSLFFREQLLLRLRAISGSELDAVFPHQHGETDTSHLTRICRWISGMFGGYSISHVSGRFKVGELKTREEVADAVAAGAASYLVDETTAIVRFLFPCGRVSDPEQESEILANRIRWFFNKLFVETILEVVNGENEVWLLESGFRSQLQVFRAEG
jgi:hypothetical protein